MSSLIHKCVFFFKPGSCMEAITITLLECKTHSINLRWCSMFDPWTKQLRQLVLHAHRSLLALQAGGLCQTRAEVKVRLQLLQKKKKSERTRKCVVLELRTGGAACGFSVPYLCPYIKHHQSEARLFSIDFSIDDWRHLSPPLALRGEGRVT